MSDNNIEKRTVCGFVFRTEADALLAKEEQKKREYIEERLNLEEPESVLVIYKKLIENQVFTTPVGLDFLKRMQTFLIDVIEVEGEEIPAIPLYMYFEDSIVSKEELIRPAAKIQTEEKNNNRSKVIILSATSILLFIMVIAMFVITIKADNPNIINYKNNLENKYAAWEQELTQRESVIREKERELNLEK